MRAVIRGPDGQETPIEGEAFFIGRDAETCNLALPEDEQVSRQHVALVGPVGGRWVAVDLRSSNGMEVNGVATWATLLNDGDRLMVGRTELRFHVEDTGVSPAVPESIQLEDVRERSTLVAVAPGSQGGDGVPAFQLMRRISRMAGGCRDLDPFLDSLAASLVSAWEAESIALVLRENESRRAAFDETWASRPERDGPGPLERQESGRPPGVQSFLENCMETRRSHLSPDVGSGRAGLVVPLAAAGHFGLLAILAPAPERFVKADLLVLEGVAETLEAVLERLLPAR